MSQQPEQLFTIKITEAGGRITKFTNQTREQVKELKARVWKCGLLIQRDANTWELVSPYMLREVLIITQVGEVSGTMENITSYQQRKE